MNPILCISKSSMPQMMYEIGKASSMNVDFVIAIICFVMTIVFLSLVASSAYKKTFAIWLLLAVIFFGATIACFQRQKNHNKTYQFNNFNYSCPAKFILQYYTVTTGKQYKFIAETKESVFIKEIK